jgi:adenylate kinase
MFNPPKEAGVCDKDGGKLYQREDDKPEVVAQRLDVNIAQTQPLIDYYSAQELLRDINGEQDIQVVFAEIKSLLRG